MLARAVVIAAGGLGQAFATTSNPVGATGDGIALAARAGAVLRDLEFVQFHPTVLWQDGAVGQRPLITEALRGSGAVLRDLGGNPVMAGRHPLGDLAPRDIVAAAMHEVIGAAAADATAAHLAAYLWLDATALGASVLEDGFPTVTKACREQGVDPVTDYIPVAPGAHYSCGGIAADLRGRTSIPGLFAVGEAASTGVHGANRLASNSLVEAVMVGRNAGESIVTAIERKSSQLVDQAPGFTGTSFTGNSGFLGDYREEGHSYWAVGAGGGRGNRGASPASRAALAAAMSRYAGVVRDRPGLLELLRIAAAISAAGSAAGSGSSPAGVDADLARARAAGDELMAGVGPGLRGTRLEGQPALALAAGNMPLHGGREPAAGDVTDGNNDLDLAVVEASNLHAVSVLIAAAGLQRTESRGCHRRRDAPRTWADVRHTLMRWTPDGLEVSSR